MSHVVAVVREEPFPKAAVEEATRAYKPMLFVAGCPVFGMGLWTALTGIAPPRTGDPRPPLWWSLMLFAILAVGVCAGLYWAIHLGK